MTLLFVMDIEKIEIIYHFEELLKCVYILKNVVFTYEYDTTSS